MKKTTMRESLFSPKQFFPIILGTFLYAALTAPFNAYEVPLVGGALVVRPTVAIPMLFGIVFGPLAGFVVGLLGNMLSDFLSLGGVFWNWEIGNGLLGAVAGIAYFVMKRTDWTKARGLAIAVVLAVVASVVGIGFATTTDYILQIGFAPGESALAEFYTFAASYAVNGAIFTPILLYAYAIATTGRARKG